MPLKFFLFFFFISGIMSPLMHLWEWNEFSGWKFCHNWCPSPCGVPVCKYSRGFVCVKAKPQEASSYPQSTGHFPTSQSLHLSLSAGLETRLISLFFPSLQSLTPPPPCRPIMCSTVPPSFFIIFCISLLPPQIFLPILASDHLSPRGYLSSNPALHQGSLHCPSMLTFIQQKSTGGNSLCVLSDPLNLAGLWIPKSSYWGIFL